MNVSILAGLLLLCPLNGLAIIDSVPTDLINSALLQYNIQSLYDSKLVEKCGKLKLLFYKLVKQFLYSSIFSSL